MNWIELKDRYIGSETNDYLRIIGRGLGGWLEMFKCLIFSSKGTFYILLVMRKINIWILEEKFLNFVRKYFRCFVTISPLKRAWPFIRTNLKPYRSRMLCVKCIWNWHINFGGEDFLISSIYFRYSPPGKGLGPSFKQTWISITQGCFIRSLVENGPVVLKKKMKLWY